MNVAGVLCNLELRIANALFPAQPGFLGLCVSLCDKTPEFQTPSWSLFLGAWGLLENAGKF